MDFITIWIWLARSAFLDGSPIFQREPNFLEESGLCWALAFLIEMSVAIWKVHFKNGFTGNGGYEFPLALAAIAFALMGYGGGPWGFNFGRSSGGSSKARRS